MSDSSFTQKSITFIKGLFIFLILAVIVIFFMLIGIWGFKRVVNPSTIKYKKLEDVQYIIPGGKSDAFLNKNEMSSHKHVHKEDFVKVKVGENEFKMQEDLDDITGAANKMSQLNQTAKKLIYVLNHKYIDNPTGFDNINDKFKARVLKGINDLTKNYTTPSLEENIPERSGGDTSFVIDKGDVFSMCLRDPKQNNKLEDDYNTLTFVLLHEMCHLFTTTYGHDFSFWSNFKFILSEAIAAGIYNGIDYKNTAKPYCGINITYSPLFDTELPSYYK